MGSLGLACFYTCLGTVATKSDLLRPLSTLFIFCVAGFVSTQKLFLYSLTASLRLQPKVHSATWPSFLQNALLCHNNVLLNYPLYFTISILHHGTVINNPIHRFSFTLCMFLDLSWLSVSQTDIKSCEFHDHCYRHWKICFCQQITQHISEGRQMNEFSEFYRSWLCNFNFRFTIKSTTVSSLKTTSLFQI